MFNRHIKTDLDPKVNTHSNPSIPRWLPDLKASNEITTGLREGYFEAEGQGSARAMFKHEMGAIDTPNRIAAGSMLALEHNAYCYTDLTYILRDE